MRDWEHYVRAHLSLPDLAPGRAARIVRELASQLEDCCHDAVASGMTAAEADAHARAQITDWTRFATILTSVDRAHVRSQVDRWSERMADHAREQQGRWLMFADLWQDVRYATRRLSAQPGFTIVAVLTLALGIGASTAIFSVVYGVLLKPLPFPDPERLVGVYHRGAGVNLPVMNQGPATYFTCRDNQRVFEDIGAWDSNEVSVTGRGEPERIEALSVWTDIYQLRPVVVISKTLAREYWQTPANAVGKRVRGFRPTWYEVVGVVGHERDDGLNHPPTAIVYWPMLNEIYRRNTISYAVRSTRLGSPAFLAEVRQAIWSVNPNLPLAAVQTLDEIRSHSMGQTSFAMVMLAIAGSVALLLGAVGIYGVMAYIAAQRTREIGIRIALGAQRADVRRLVLGHGMALTGAGIALGLIGALGVTRIMRALLYETSPIDPVTFAGVVPVLMAAALLACWLPARRAMRADPIVALRCE